MRSGPIAEEVASANEQHYELPAEFFELFLGPRMKYSCAWWGDGIADLAVAEEAMLALSCERAGIEDGMSVLDLGCGWGSMSLWICERYPRRNCRRGFQLGLAARVDRGPPRPSRVPRSPQRDHRRCQRVDAGPAL